MSEQQLQPGAVDETVASADYLLGEAGDGNLPDQERLLSAVLACATLLRALVLRGAVRPAEEEHGGR